MLKDINKSQIQKFPATRSSVITPFWFSAKTTSRYYVYVYLNKICLFLVEQWVILNCLGLFQICMDTKLKKKLNCHCAVTTCSRKTSFFRMAELPGQLFTCSVTFWKVMEKKGKLSTKWIVPLIAQCWLGRDFNQIWLICFSQSKGWAPEQPFLSQNPSRHGPILCRVGCMGKVPTSSLLGIFSLYSWSTMDLPHAWYWM